MPKCEFTFYDEKGKLDTNNRFSASFNPTEYTLSKNVQFAEHPIPGLDSPILQFVRGQAETVSLDLFFDTTDKGTPVTTETDEFYRLAKINGDTHTPPVCLFTWGTGFAGSSFPGKGWDHQKRNGFTCVIESIRQRFSFFTGDGVPLRAMLTVGLKEYKSVQRQLYELNLQSADQTRSHTVKQGETLNDIATDVYGDSNAWRPIADANKLTDPLGVEAGKILTIPPLF